MAGRLAELSERLIGNFRAINVKSWNDGDSLVRGVKKAARGHEHHWTGIRHYGFSNFGWLFERRLPDNSGKNSEHNRRESNYDGLAAHISTRV